MSVGSKDDSYNNATAESQFALFMTDLIKKRRPWKTVEQIELVTLEWVWWSVSNACTPGLAACHRLELGRPTTLKKAPS